MLIVSRFACSSNYVDITHTTHPQTHQCDLHKLQPQLELPPPPQMRVTGESQGVAITAPTFRSVRDTANRQAFTLW